MQFTYAAYADLLAALSRRFSLHPLRDFRPADDPRLYLRHDIDVALEPALRMAREEAAHGVSSTYMFIPTSPLYELTADVLKSFTDLGHEVAIHFDYLTSGVEPDDIEDPVRLQCDDLASMTGEPVKSISFHRPIPSFLNGPDHLFGMVNAYSATLMENYRSDSAGRWRQEPSDLRGNVAQLLTHPVWWSYEHDEPSERLKALNADEATLRETVPGVAW